MDDLALLDATAQAELVRRREASAAELVDAAITRIEKLDGELNAVVIPRFERARETAGRDDLPDGPFRGVPFLTKDLWCVTKDEPLTNGMRFLKDAGFVARDDSHLARRWREAGFVNLGFTNSPELGLLPTTEPEAYGPTHNPWDLERTPGGSSGGSCAAVAAGLTPIAHASDGGGSIRIPASCCGLVGLKPSRGRVSNGPQGGDLTRFLSVQLGVSTSVRDVAALLDVAAGPEPGDAIIAPAPARPFADEVGADPGRLRIGIATSVAGNETHPECVEAAEQAGRVLESLGHHVEVAHPPDLDDRATGVGFMAVWMTNAAVALDTWGAIVGREVAETDVEPLTWVQAEQGRALSALRYVDALNQMQAFTRRVAQWWQDGFDLLLTPTVAHPPPRLGELPPRGDNPLADYGRVVAFVPFTPAFNVTGQPAVSLPLGSSADGLPIGVQLVAAYGREDMLIRVASQLETAAPWADRRPPVHA
ncbi:MAG TPA: amidase [Acidimicrobiia bacterium]|nr:amidase [Acidimicrobiia bacterium]